jgi:hypothetical protein
MSSAGEDENPTLKAVRKAFQEGKLDHALVLGKELEKAKPALRKDAGFALLMAQILIEAEAPTSQVRALLMEAMLEGPKDPSTLQDYLDIVQAKGLLGHEARDSGEILLGAVLRRSPENVHANFLLGSHLFWVEKQPGKAIKHLEAAVKSRPVFLRAVACLGALYQTLGNAALAAKCFRKCKELESAPAMKKYFDDLLKTVSGK